MLSTIIIVCKQLSCDSVKDNDLFLSIFIAGTAIHSLIVKEEFIVSRWKSEITNCKEENI